MEKFVAMKRSMEKHNRLRKKTSLFKSVPLPSSLGARKVSESPLEVPADVKVGFAFNDSLKELPCQNNNSRSMYSKKSLKMFRMRQT